jgi:hypothetical protein
MRDKLRWIVGVIAMTCCMPSFGQKEEEDFRIPIHYTVVVPEENPLSQFADRDYACGNTITLRANELPVNISDVGLDRAYELDEQGRIKMEWPLPIDATPLAINGNRLLIHQDEAGEEFAFVTPDGKIGTTVIDPSEAPTLNDDGDENSVDCPGSSEEWDMCSSFVDVTTGASRTIAYQVHCS